MPAADAAKLAPPARIVLAAGLPARCASSGRDPYGNCQHVLTLDYPHQDITVLATGVVEVDEALADDVDDELAPLVFLRQTTRTAPSAARLALAQRHAEAVRQHGRHGALTLAQALAEQPGAAKDSVGASHALLGCLRARWRQPARYVSGYLSLADGGEVAHHNWVELWRDGVWASVDPMSLARPAAAMSNWRWAWTSWTPARFAACAGPAWKICCDKRNTRRSNNRQIVHHAVFVPEFPG